MNKAEECLKRNPGALLVLKDASNAILWASPAFEAAFNRRIRSPIDTTDLFPQDLSDKSHKSDLLALRWGFVTELGATAGATAAGIVSLAKRASGAGRLVIEVSPADDAWRAILQARWPYMAPEQIRVLAWATGTTLSDGVAFRPAKDAEALGLSVESANQVLLEVERMGAVKLGRSSHGIEVEAPWVWPLLAAARPLPDDLAKPLVEPGRDLLVAMQERIEGIEKNSESAGRGARRMLLEALEATSMAGNQDLWRVGVVKPGPNSGKNLQLAFKPPKGSGEKRYRRSAGTADPAEAATLAKIQEAKLNDADALGLKVTEIMDLHLASVREDVRTGILTEHTLRNYEDARRIAGEFLGDQRAGDFCRGGAQAEFRTDLMKAGYKLSSANLVLRQVRASWRAAARDDLVPRLPPIARVRGKKKAEARTRKRGYTPAEIKALLGAAPGGHRRALMLLADTGARCSEVLGLRPSDFRRDELGRWAIHLEETKTGSDRIVPVPKATAEEILDGASPGGDLFLSEKGCRITVRLLFRHCAVALDKLGMRRVVHVGRNTTYDLDVHSLRRSWIAHASRAGVVESVRMRITGHELQGTHGGYERNYGGADELHEAIATVVRWRLEKLHTKEGLVLMCSNGYNSFPGNTQGGQGDSSSEESTLSNAAITGPPAEHTAKHTAWLDVFGALLAGWQS